VLCLLPHFLPQSAVDAGAISARAKPAAAAEKLKELLDQLKQRGCVEEFVPDPDLLLNGQVCLFDFGGGLFCAGARGGGSFCARGGGGEGGLLV
jgi:hypothetical protein